MANSQYPCLCALIRKTGRVVTRNYDRFLKASGLKVTQFSMMANISKKPAITVTELAELMVMDQTTVSRNLRVLEQSGFIRFEEETTDHRIRRIHLTQFGSSKMKEAIPLWEKAQQETEQILGRETIVKMIKTHNKLIG